MSQEFGSVVVEKVTIVDAVGTAFGETEPSRVRARIKTSTIVTFDPTTPTSTRESGCERVWSPWVAYMYSNGTGGYGPE